MGRPSTRPAPKSGAALRYERLRREATEALRAQAAQHVEVTAPPRPAHPVGAWPIADLREGQCRFPCTSFRAQPADHRFCGEPVAWKGGKPTSWCREHLPVVSGAPGRHAGGASVADVEALEAAKGA
ncbi:hypothetical protein [Methylobacterium pseudosasicola]|uniref:Uncharacterized protein n=1 Tax=Methylobacterium pseudosasicola TaxID=582667 RepID=A0A1I4URA6_9HYPH|nr:hypothetical protein [Methylobacterium pseudosasicola]SFM91280.1 hypothetical protein SAMN05192568_10754 [Methylobacterium pseudosasicola]